MINLEIRAKYVATIGIECHVQLKTHTKLFAAVANDAREAPPNTLVSHICFGMPGALPVLNAEAVRLASKAAFALGSVPQKYSKFDRKHYFYPDLPLGYQITQFDEPIILGGSVTIRVDGTEKSIGITRAHLESDAGKSTHPAGKNYSLVDLNRAGTPLLEIVSEPDMHTAAEAKAYARELYLRMKYADVSEANLYYGNMRFDVNVSVSLVSAGAGVLGTRTETKNINSFKAVERVVDYEIARQIEILEKSDAPATAIAQETRGWDDSKQRTFSQRTKEDAHDYRYFPDPDLPPITLSDAYIANIKASMPLLPDDYRVLLSKVGLDVRAANDIIAVPDTARRVHQIYTQAGENHAKRVAFWLLQPQIDEVTNDPLQADSTIQTDGITNEQYISVSKMVEANKLSSTAAKDLIAALHASGGDPESLAKSMDILQESDVSAVTVIVDQVLQDNPQAAQDVKNGEMKAIGFLIGQVMKQSAGQANPALAQQLIKKQLDI